MSDFDLVVVGAGIHGAGIAHAAASTGRSVCIVERHAVAAGTSSRSSKLIHGGLRYLETAQFSLVRHSLAERRRLTAERPGLVRALPMHVPVYRGMARGPLTIRAGLTLYALLGGLGADARFSKVRRDDWHTLDGLSTDGLQAVYRYQESQTDDAALTRAVVDDARALGAELRVPAELVAAEPDGARVACAVRGADGERTLTARVLVNAAGPWAPSVADRIRPRREPPAFELVQGTHVEYAGPPPAAGAYYVEAQDGRAVFVLPYGGRTLVGTTELVYRGDPDECAPTDFERRYLHETFARHFPGRADERPLTAWAGLRVLPWGAADAFDRPRDTVMVVDDPRRPRVLSLYGGKLTTFRTTAARALALVEPSLR